MVTDLIFISEILVCFNTSYIRKDENHHYELSRWNIAIKYVKGWLLIDFMAILPRFINLAYTEDAEESNASLLALMKFGRISRIVKLYRLVKILKAAKAKDSLDSRMKAQNSSVALERITSFSIIGILIVHTVACLQIFAHREVQFEKKIHGSDETSWIT